MAAYDFSANEIFEMAIEIEVKGQEFYKKAAADAENEELKKILLDLADMEVDHEETFKQMKSDLKISEKESNVFDPENEAAAYLKALADTKVFYEKEIDTKSVKEVMKAAVTAEKDSIVFYLGMKGLVPEKKGQDKLDKIISEEMSHIRIITSKLMPYVK
ncbi:MAG: ferritin family protein [Desulfobacteraceae bacterium]|nr:ferritin family protein [Desulfobacteraceae bacterium]MCB9494190.1 ferritin family protein [Desulfobacteraceae bacterium]